MTLSEVAQYLRVTRQTIYNHLWKKQILGYRVGRHWRFKKSEIDKWLSTQTEKNTKRK